MTSMEEPTGSVAPDADLSAELARVRAEREALAGVAVLTGAMWARVVGIYLAGLSAILNIVFLAGYPVNVQVFPVGGAGVSVLAAGV